MSPVGGVYGPHNPVPEFRDSGYTPTMDEAFKGYYHLDGFMRTVRRAEFERALAVHDREVREQGVKPDRETIIGALDLYFDHDTNDIGEAVDAILAAWPGRTEAEVREEVLREFEKVAQEIEDLRISHGDYFNDNGDHRYGAHVRTIVDPDSKPFPTARTVSVADWLRERIARGQA